LKDNICGLVEQGNFELLLAGKKQDKYFLAPVDTEYGKNAREYLRLPVS